MSGRTNAEKSEEKSSESSGGSSRTAWPAIGGAAGRSACSVASAIARFLSRDQRARKVSFLAMPRLSFGGGVPSRFPVFLRVVMALDERCDPRHQIGRQRDAVNLLV